ncbi:MULTISPECIES: response regulator transcription factor [Burkholderia cepacia complex]|uniref:response regulator transcription factor n=1 Tax=Burkholderia cepacia complex TaxID=87882 RepID=UPI00075A17BE|nr:response regulator transcription factor [Burkholderia vietnamiensis]MCA8142902.1 response regulator transcription factor [Burkholderia multivorans]KVF31878.1 two-component system response regulator [Burkholderia vietnamiensis]KVF43206.1 two-component system response regulator [Burkholderia vietnamiensis]MCA8290818.1 response regulator transcription factor [Burkholderia vietnamiensis]WVN04609.1 response regulator transcription factor [Burkholderia multivorans]
MRVLIVEDDPVHAKAAARVVAPLGHEVIEAGDGQEAQRRLRAEPFDLVILDWLLPGMSGFEVLYWIRRTLGAAPAVLFVTSKTLEDDIVLAMDAGANDYIVKPFRVAELFFSNVGKLLSRKLVCMSTWGRELDPESRTLDTHIYRLRQKLELCPENGVRLSAVYTHGYRLEAVSSHRDHDGAAALRQPAEPVSAARLTPVGLECE